MRESEKVRRYENTHPGVDIPPEQKAERYDRVQVKKKYGRAVGNRRSAIVGSMVVPDSLCWCTRCGKFRHEGDCNASR